MEEEPIKQEAPDAPALPEEREEQTESFQSLIQGKYREDYLAALSEALRAQARETNRYRAYRELRDRAEALKAEYPAFDLDRELEDPGFARLLNNGVDPRTAYEVVHHAELTGQARQLARNAARPLENGLSPAPAAVAKPDPRQLTRAERRALRRRAARGEEIIW